MRDPLVSIVTATYKTDPAHLKAAIESALAQSYTNFEILIGDDSPDDSVQKTVAQWGDPRISYVQNRPALGVARNHWSAFARAKGEYIAVLNHDDLFAPTFLEQLLRPMQVDTSLSLAFCDHWVIDGQGKITEEQSHTLSARYGRATLAAGVHRPIAPLLARQTIPMVMGAMFRKADLPADLPADAGPAYDLWLVYFLGRNGKGAFYVPEKLSSWRAHPQNLTSQGGVNWANGTALCWQAISADPDFAAIAPYARSQAALAWFECAKSCWMQGKRAECAHFARLALQKKICSRTLLANVLPVLPRGLSKWLFK